MTDALRCPHCGAAVAAHDSFCETCGGQLVPTEQVPAGTGGEAPIDLSRSSRQSGPVDGPGCPTCGGALDADGSCPRCGADGTPARDHFELSPSSWVGGVCDRGRRHHRNEDAMALHSDPEPGRRAVLVVCDGVSTAPDSDRASLVAATTARDLLSRHRPSGMGTPESRTAALASGLVEAGRAADEAVGAIRAEGSSDGPSCTFAAAVVEGDLCVYGLIGDSRVYWLPDDGPPRQLGEDDSVAAMRVAAGVDRDTAESSPGAHAITRWLGPDSPDTRAQTGAVPLDRPGWVLVCSDGLWNYASDPQQLQQLVRAQVGAGATGPTQLAAALVAWANEQGGRDNITVALARAGAAAY
ncbi:serine/threonine protein phosphatase [Auraticoccus sp. F435]|uniref:Serine/threonine protein phosphatase n=1 Tax=Auraticoccus cholistanensis TaxID=2656650 RepID=A0A6A9UTZ9_9ACTN|nr:protein phosphatase 2C domain-containing protein [Auraticoccus cholistanensis]MVA76151.1 serine/threonine protein phosphatase [Auraticoccus cholistanensis]